jgi:hypothetical protein
MFRRALSGAPARRFFAAHAQSCLGTGLAYVALPLLAYDRFDTPWAIAAVLLPDLLPAIVLGPLLGALVDRIGWRTCAVVADILRALAFVLVMSADSLPAMMVGAFVAGIGTALFTPAALAGLPRLVDGDEGKAAAMGLYGAIDDIGLTAGPAIAALGLALVSPATLIGINALTFAVSAVLIGSVAVRGGGLIPRRTTSLLADARAGVRELASRPEIRTLLGSSTGVVFASGSRTSARSSWPARCCTSATRAWPRWSLPAGWAPSWGPCARASPRRVRGPGATPTWSASGAWRSSWSPAPRSTPTGSPFPLWRWAASATGWRSSTTGCCSRTRRLIG